VTDLESAGARVLGASEIEMNVPADNPTLPAKDGFAWTVLTALASDVDVRVSAPDVLTIELSRGRPAQGLE
jgi:hypothetical protein